MTETQAQSAEDTGAGNAELNKLYEKENAIIAKHQELWNTVFNNIDKDKAADAGEQNYGTFLETQLDHVKDQFSEADLKKLDKDIEEIKKIEDQVTELTAQMGTENSGTQSANAEKFMKKVRSASQIRQAEVAKDTKRKLNKDRKPYCRAWYHYQKALQFFYHQTHTDERFDTLLAEYEAEQKALVTSVLDAESHLSSFEEDTDRAAQFLTLAKKYTDFSELP